MGRIADALKKAEQERAETGDVAVADPVTTDSAPPGIDPSALTETDTETDRPDAVETAEQRPEPDAVEGPAGALHRVSLSLVALHGDNSILIEQYRALRTRLSSQNPRAKSRVLAITSSLAGEGKSVTAANLSIVMAEVRHHHVLALDADFRRSRLSALFGVDPGPGLVEVLQDEASIEEVERPTPVPNLKLIGAGATGGINPAELLSSKRAAAIFDDLRHRYSYVLIDTPPSSDVADAGIVGQLADGVLMVIRMGKTPQPVVKQIVQALQASQVNLIGCILTGADDSTSPYSNYYGSYAPDAEV